MPTLYSVLSIESEPYFTVRSTTFLNKLLGQLDILKGDKKHFGYFSASVA